MQLRSANLLLRQALALSVVLLLGADAAKLWTWVNETDRDSSQVANCKGTATKNAWHCDEIVDSDPARLRQACENHYTRHMEGGNVYIQCAITTNGQCLAAGGLCKPSEGASPPSQIWKGDQDALRFLTRQNGQVTSLWKELYEGDGMTWEVMMKFREKPKSNTALMHTYGKKFNDNTYSSSHRRRAVGIFVGPSGQHHIFGCAGSNVHTGDKGPDLWDDKWHHIVLVLSKSTQQITYYVDGTKIASASYNPGSNNPGVDGEIFIGGGTLERYYGSEISRFAIWDRALSEAEVTDAKTCKAGTNGLKVLYTLETDYKDSQGGYLDLQRALSKGSFGSCADCKHCPKYS